MAAEGVLTNPKAAELAQQVAGAAAQQAYLRARLELVEVPMTDIAKEEQARKMAQQAWEHAFQEASLTGTYQGVPTTQWLTTQAGLTGQFQGQQTFPAAVTEAGVTGTFGGQPTLAAQLGLGNLANQTAMTAAQIEQMGAQNGLTAAQIENMKALFGVTESQATGYYKGAPTLQREQIMMDASGYLGGTPATGGTPGAPGGGGIGSNISTRIGAPPPGSPPGSGAVGVVRYRGLGGGKYAPGWYRKDGQGQWTKVSDNPPGQPPTPTTGTPGTPGAPGARGAPTLAREQFEAGVGMQLLQELNKLQGPDNAFRLARALNGTPQGLRDILGAMAGRFQLPGMGGGDPSQVQPATMETLLQAALGGGGQPIANINTTAPAWTGGQGQAAGAMLSAAPPAGPAGSAGALTPIVGSGAGIGPVAVPPPGGATSTAGRLTRAGMAAGTPAGPSSAALAALAAGAEPGQMTTQMVGAAPPPPGQVGITGGEPPDARWWKTMQNRQAADILQADPYAAMLRPQQAKWLDKDKNLDKFGGRQPRLLRNLGYPGGAVPPGGVPPGGGIPPGGEPVGPTLTPVQQYQMSAAPMLQGMAYQPETAPPGGAPGNRGYTLSPPGAPAPADAWNYQPMPDSSALVYPPGVQAPPGAAQVSTASPLDPMSIQQLNADAMSQLGNVPLPSQTNAENYGNANPYQQQLYWAAQEATGWDESAAKASFAASLPQASSSLKGTLRL